MCVLVNIVVVLIVATQSDQTSNGQSIREEDLGDCIDPHLNKPLISSTNTGQG